MAKKILFLTGKLAEKQLKKILKSFSNKDFNFEVRQIGISVAALMTSRLIQRRVPNKLGAKKILLPGLFHGDIDELSSFYKTHVERGPEDLKDLPEFFGKGKNKPDLSRYDCKIFSEIDVKKAMTSCLTFFSIILIRSTSILDFFLNL